MDIPEEPTFITYAKQDNGTGAKRTSGEIRDHMLSHGAVLIRFQTPPDTPKEYIDQWRTVEAKGFHVTADGCIFPYKYYWSSFQKGDKNKGHQRSFAFFHRRRADKQDKINEYGWPAKEQISHLCHRENCINPLHLVAEPQWCNLRRNYCGLEGKCTCGMHPSCLQTYKSWSFFLDDVIKDDPGVVCTEAEVLEVLAELRGRFSFVVLKKTHYTKEDQKSQARKKRKMAGKRSQPSKVPKVDEPEPIVS